MKSPTSEVLSQKRLDKLLQRQGETVLRILSNDCVDISDGTYYLCGLTHDTLRMLYSIMKNNMTSQEAKAAYKVALDSVIMDFGMSVQIHEFN